jgi:hypothetical protein
MVKGIVTVDMNVILRASNHAGVDVMIMIVIVIELFNRG